MIPHSIGDGTPMKYRPAPVITPNAALIPSCVRKYRDSRRAASFIAAVVRCRSDDPNSRISRSRRSSRCSSTKIATISTIAVVDSGLTIGERTRSASSIGEGSG